MTWTALHTTIFTIGSYHVSWVDLIGYAGAALALTTFCMTTMLHLRVAAMGASVVLFVFGFLTEVYPTMALQLMLFPINTFKLLHVLKLVGRAERSPEQGGLSFASLKPLMIRRRVPAGTTLMRKGDIADKLFYLERGTLAIAELGKTLEPGAVLGEIGVFAADQRRTATVVSLTDCEVYELTERRTKELCFQNPAFGYAVMQLIIGRLLENQQAAAPHIVAPPVAPDPVDATLVPSVMRVPAMAAVPPIAEMPIVPNVPVVPNVPAATAAAPA